MSRAATPQVSFADLEFTEQGIFLDPVLQTISNFLDEHEEIIAKVRRDLERGLKNPATGRNGLTPSQVLRALVLMRQLGVHVALPERGRLSRKRAQPQEQRWFKRALRWRAGNEATISHLKHPFSMAGALYKAERGFQRYVGWSVITKNLFSIARWQERRRQQQRNHEQVDGILGPAA
jgi:hypothetical protein